MISKWNIKDGYNEKEIEQIAEKFSLSPVVAKVLAARGIKTEQEISKFLNPSISDMYDPMLMKDMDKAVDRISAAVEAGEKIMIFGDYDADGITSTAMLYRFLSHIGSVPLFFIPNRIDDGYGLSTGGVDYAVRENVRLIITVDCGTTAFEEIDYARSRHIDVIVTDHHEVLKKLPDALAIVNPNRSDDRYPFKHLAGCGVAFKLIQALAKRFELEENIVEKYFGLVTLGTIADVVPLIDENRVIAFHGLRRLSDSQNPGVRKLCEVSQIQIKRISSFHIGFVLAPRINAMGRMSDATDAVKLLITDDEKEAENIAKLLDEKNRKRQQVDMDVYEEAVSIIESQNMTKRNSIVLAKENWHEGVIGIVASRIVEKYNKPTIMISLSDEFGKGSGRSIPEFHLYDALAEIEDILESFGGHRLAAGITIKRENLSKFISRFEELTLTKLGTDEITRKLDIDCEIDINEIDLQLEAAIADLSPFGFGNPKPMFASKGLTVVGYPSLIKDRHMRLHVKNSGKVYEAIWFNNGKDIIPKIIKNPENISIAYYITRNEFLGNVSIQLHVADIKCGEETDV